MVIVSSACRALADQLEGTEEEHEKYRHMVVQYIANNREMFEPFIEDEVPFDEYCQSMEKDGRWAGHMELQAASLVTHNNICIHRHMSPRWYIRNFDNQAAQMIHLSYHDGEHYNSVRLKEDPCDGPARPIIIKQVRNKQKLQVLVQSQDLLKTLYMEEPSKWSWLVVVARMLKKLSRFCCKLMAMLTPQSSS
uniref:OTU domain-containing protein n=1 Tax=Opuntia streptacantha TaxID=393608 RepID=A0A7C8ZWS5_OPUST